MAKSKMQDGKMAIWNAIKPFYHFRFYHFAFTFSLAKLIASFSPHSGNIGAGQKTFEVHWKRLSPAGL